MSKQNWMIILMLLAGSLSMSSYMQWQNDPHHRSLNDEVRIVKDFFGFTED